MSHIALCDAATPTAHEDDAAALPPVPRPVDLILAEGAGTGWLTVGGPSPLEHPAHLDVLRRLTAMGRRLKLRLSAPPPNGDFGPLRAAGVEHIHVLLHAADPTQHDAVTGVAGSGEVALLTLRQAHAARIHVEVHARLGAANVDGTLKLAELARAHDAPLHLAYAPTSGRPRLARLAALIAVEAIAREADHDGGRVFASGLVGPPERLTGPVEGMPLGPNTLRLLMDGVPLPSAAGGVTLRPDAPSQVDPLALAAARAPLLPSPAPPPSTPVEGPIHLVLPAISDATLSLAGMPGLRDALLRRGADVRWWSVWGAPADVIPPTTGPARTAEVAAAHAKESDWLAALDLRGAALVVVAGFHAAAAVAAHPTLPGTARVVIVDMHMLAGFDAWAAQTGGAWPERFTVHSCFPGYAHLYLRKRVPLDRVRWRPYPIDPVRLPPGPPAADCERAFAGGNQRRAWSTLLSACRGLPAGRGGVDLYTRDRPPESLPASLAWRGTADLRGFHRAIAESRFVVVPMSWDRDVASGITVIAMALAAGRPVIASLTPASLDHVRPGVDGLLVPAGRPDALGTAIRRLLDDDNLVRALAAGASEAARSIGVDGWADELLRGHGARPPVGAPGGPWRPW